MAYAGCIERQRKDGDDDDDKLDIPETNGHVQAISPQHAPSRVSTLTGANSLLSVIVMATSSSCQRAPGHTRSAQDAAMDHRKITARDAIRFMN